MLPPEQENSTTNSISRGTSVNSLPDNISLHIERPVSSSNVSPFPDHNRTSHKDGTRYSVLRESIYPVTLQFEDVSYTIKLQNSETSLCCSSETKVTRRILNSVSGLVRPGELLAMLGPSGSGKTTLLTALSGRLPGKVSGSIKYNGLPLSSSIKRKTGFVTQDDVLYPHLTVLETLTYTARLKLPSSLSKEEKIEQAEMIIVELGLTRCRNSIVGGPLLRGISGGERKRVSIGQEMLVNPSLLLVDEPTSGLDSTTAQRIVGTLRWAARGGRTVVTTIHQPSSRLFRMFDKVIVMSDGCPIYSGGANRVMDYFAFIGYVPGFNFMNPADFLLDLANGVTNDSEEDEENHVGEEHHDDTQSTKQFLIYSYKKNLLPLLKEEIHKANHDQPSSRRSSPSRRNQWANSWWLQFKVLLSRGLKERKHESYSGLRIFQVLSVAIISGLLWWHSDANRIQDQVGLLFFFSIFWGFFPLFNAIFVFPQERPVLARERSSGMYRLSSYYIARIVGDLPMELVLPTIFVTISYWMGGLKPSLITYLLTLSIILINVLVAQGLGLALGAVLMDVKQATTLSSVLMLVFLLASGYYIQHIPSFIVWLKYISFSQYCYKLLVGVQYSYDEVYDCGLGSICRVADSPAIRNLGAHDHMLTDIVALMLMLVGNNPNSFSPNFAAVFVPQSAICVPPQRLTSFAGGQPSTVSLIPCSCTSLRRNREGVREAGSVLDFPMSDFYGGSERVVVGAGVAWVACGVPVGLGWSWPRRFSCSRFLSLLPGVRSERRPMHGSRSVVVVGLGVAAVRGGEVACPQLWTVLAGDRS
ncbi:ABC transporter G family member 21 [Striga hermonthica]|uniref:ABC transporter G family member 21 n=1 Tax=Striga hermonthica TaxID=68872 RepID=A0A9N7RI69_STRHE|nr:ABC transporter G family member 21 [Striga hermonthica]